MHRSLGVGVGVGVVVVLNPPSPRAKIFLYDWQIRLIWVKENWEFKYVGKGNPENPWTRHLEIKIVYEDIMNEWNNQY